MNTNQKQQLLDSKSLNISCIVPVHNESVNIKQFTQELVAEIKKQTNEFEIILVDDGSKDDSLTIIENELLNDPHIKLIAFSRNFGKENALTAGLANCHGDVAILIDSDFQHPIDLIPSLLQKWADGYDMAYTVRRDRRDESYLKRLFSKAFYRSMGLMSEVKLPTDAGDFRILDRAVINALNACGEYSRFMKGLYAWVGFKATPLTYEPNERQGGKTSWPFFKLVDLALTGIISFSDLPLRVWSLVGMVISGISLLYAVWIVLKTLVFGVDLPGFATIVVAIVFFGGVQLISIGILGEYIARIFREVKRRPQYIIAKKSGFNEEH